MSAPKNVAASANGLIGCRNATTHGMGLAQTLDKESLQTFNFRWFAHNVWDFAGLSTGSEASACYQVPNSRTVALLDY
jgi:hypothetical protein